MNVYRVTYRKCGGFLSAGFSWHSTQVSASAAASKAVDANPDDYPGGVTPEIQPIDIPITTNGVLAALRKYAVHPTLEA